MISDILRPRALDNAGGAYRWYAPDFVLLPEYAIALVADDLRKRGKVALPADKLLIVADHFCPPATIERAEILRLVQQTCKDFGWDLRLFDGICHQLMIEDPRIGPGKLVVGSDSHTCTAGALGALAMGFGSTDVYAALVHGRIALRTPEVVRVNISGRFRPGVMGKDLILEIFRRCGHQALNYRALELVDRTDDGISQDSRFSICNLMVEAGGKAALFQPDAITTAYLKARDEAHNFDFDLPLDDAVQTLDIDLAELAPMVALPHNPFNVVPLSEAPDVELTQVYLGSCNAGRLEDLAIAAQILDGNRIATGLKAIVVPGSRQVYLDALDRGYIRNIIESGAIVATPSCGACGGIDKGILASGERCAATMNRNYRGRMGSPDAEIFLVNAAVAATSMLTGRLTAPEDAVCPV